MEIVVSREFGGEFKGGVILEAVYEMMDVDFGLEYGKNVINISNVENGVGGTVLNHEEVFDG